VPDSDINLAPAYLAQLGYQQKEFFLAGTARSYTPTLPLPTDGKLVVTADPEVLEGNYKTRLVVFRPIDPNDFNGTVIVEWFNVTAGNDTNPDWIMVHNEFIREGYAYVGVSAQAVGVNALKNSTTPAWAARYASLNHPGDSYSYDIFSRAGLLAKESAAILLSGLTAERVIATGESQSASRMVTYINAVQPLEQVYDGFMVHSRSGSGSSIRQTPLDNPVSYPAPAPIRDDLNVPVMVVQAEGDVINSNLLARQLDTPLFRAWEMAGTSHADSYTLPVGLLDNGDGSGAVRMFNFMRGNPINNLLNCDTATNSGGHHWIMQAAFHALDTWVQTAVPPPVGPQLDVDVESSTPSSVVLFRDAQGNALGGVRSPQVDAPVATLDSNGTGLFFCRLFGRTIPLTPVQILALYPTQADFTTQWLNSINLNVANGFLLQADGDDLEAAAAAWDYFPN
jgi:Alpha/beta hydrolase domain